MENPNLLERFKTNMQAAEKKEAPSPNPVFNEALNAVSDLKTKVEERVAALGGNLPEASLDRMARDAVGQKESRDRLQTMGERLDRWGNYFQKFEEVNETREELKDAEGDALHVLKVATTIAEGPQNTATFEEAHAKTIDMRRSFEKNSLPQRLVGGAPEFSKTEDYYGPEYLEAEEKWLQLTREQQQRFNREREERKNPELKQLREENAAQKAQIAELNQQVQEQKKRAERAEAAEEKLTKMEKELEEEEKRANNAEKDAQRLREEAMKLNADRVAAEVEKEQLQTPPPETGEPALEKESLADKAKKLLTVHNVFGALFWGAAGRGVAEAAKWATGPAGLAASFAAAGVQSALRGGVELHNEGLEKVMAKDWWTGNREKGVGGNALAVGKFLAQGTELGLGQAFVRGISRTGEILTGNRDTRNNVNILLMDCLETSGQFSNDRLNEIENLARSNFKQDGVSSEEIDLKTAEYFASVSRQLGRDQELGFARGELEIMKKKYGLSTAEATQALENIHQSFLKRSREQIVALQRAGKDDKANKLIQTLAEGRRGWLNRKGIEATYLSGRFVAAGLKGLAGGALYDLIRGGGAPPVLAAPSPVQEQPYPPGFETGYKLPPVGGAEVPMISGEIEIGPTWGHAMKKFLGDHGISHALWGQKGSELWGGLLKQNLKDTDWIDSRRMAEWVAQHHGDDSALKVFKELGYTPESGFNAAAVDVLVAKAQAGDTEAVGKLQSVFHWGKKGAKLAFSLKK